MSDTEDTTPAEDAIAMVEARLTAAINDLADRLTAGLDAVNARVDEIAARLG